LAATNFFFFQTVQSQTVESKSAVDNDNKPYNTSGVEVKPLFPGGINAFYHFIGNNFRVPDVPGLKGKVLISFVIEKDGSISDSRVLKDIGYGTGIEAIRVLSLSPKWTPAEQNGKTVRCAYMLPISIEASK
jgi:protein TonB